MKSIVSWSMSRRQLRGHRGEARLGVALGGGRVVVDVAEVALRVDERVAERERLRHADEGVVDRLVAVRVVLPHHVADDAGALDRSRFGCSPSSFIA